MDRAKNMLGRGCAIQNKIENNENLIHNSIFWTKEVLRTFLPR